MHTARATALAAVVLLVTSTGCVATELVLAKTERPSANAGYVAGLFSRDTIARFAFGVENLKTHQEYVVSLEDQDVGLVELPAGSYRVRYWVAFAFTHERIGQQDIPPGHRLGVPFDLAPGQVVLFGRWAGDRSGRTLGLTPVSITEEEAAATLRAAYPGFAAAPVTCPFCKP